MVFTELMREMANGWTESTTEASWVRIEGKSQLREKESRETSFLITRYPVKESTN